MTNINRKRDTHQRTGTDQYEHTFDPTTVRVTEELLLAVAAVSNSDPTTLSHLPDTLDPDALDTLFSTTGDESRRLTDGQITFEYEGYHVQITTDGTITLE